MPAGAGFYVTGASLAGAGFYGTDRLDVEACAVYNLPRQLLTPERDLLLSKQLKADLWLALVTLIWGSTFVIVKNELAAVEPLTFVALRFTFAFLAMVVVARHSLGRMDRRQLAAGVLIGIFLFGGFALQTVGLRYTTASKTAFITGLCVVLAPLFARLLLAHKPSLTAALGVAAATGGLALLSLNDDLAVAPGDLLVLGCAVSFALHIVAIGGFSPRMDSTALTTVQIGVVALASIALVGITEPSSAVPGLSTLAVAAGLGIVATAFAFSIQNRVQAFTTPTHTALVLTLEPVFGALFAFLLAGERLDGRQMVGCALILGGMVVAELRGRVGD